MVANPPPLPLSFVCFLLFSPWTRYSIFDFDLAFLVNAFGFWLPSYLPALDFRPVRLTYCLSSFLLLFVKRCAPVCAIVFSFCQTGILRRRLGNGRTRVSTSSFRMKKKTLAMVSVYLCVPFGNVQETSHCDHEFSPIISYDSKVQNSISRLFGCVALCGVWAAFSSSVSH